MTHKIDSIRSEEKIKPAGWAGIISIVIGAILFISSALLMYVPEGFSRLNNISLLEPEAQTIGMLILYYFCFVGLVALVGVFIGIYSVMKKNVWAWLGIIINMIVFMLIPLCWLLMLTILATG
ncbi:MAG: hypothetical protein AABZ00_15520 [Chloroflexota bacterium]